MVFNDPKGNQLRSLKRAPRQIAVATDLRNASVSGGRTRFVGLLSLIVEGSQLVSGLLYISGTLRAIGAIFLDGITTVTGVWNQNGPWNLAGAGGITGDVVQTGTTRVRGGGKVIVEGTDPVTLGLTPSGRPGLQFGTGSQIIGTSDGAQLTNAGGNGFVYANVTVGMQRGSKSVEVSSTGVEVTAPFKIQSLPIAPGGTTVYLVVSDSSGNLYRMAVAA